MPLCYAPSSLTVESRLNLASTAGSTGPSFGSSHARFIASMISTSVLVRSGSLSRQRPQYQLAVTRRKSSIPRTHRLSRSVPLNSTLSCGTRAKRPRRTFKPRSAMFFPSITILPFCMLTILKSAWSRELLPAPVLPAIPTYAPAV